MQGEDDRSTKSFKNHKNDDTILILLRSRTHSLTVHVIILFGFYYVWI